MKYTDDNNIIKPYISRQGGSRSVVQIDPKTNTVIRSFISAAEAARVTGADSSTITKVCKGKLKTTKGFIWSYWEE